MTNAEESRLDRIERVLDALATNLANETDARLALREDIEITYQLARQTAEAVDSLSRSVAQLVENADADRTENRRIWEYLESQQRHQGNGHG